MAGNNGNGRKKGTLNKKTQSVIDRLVELGCDPIEGMVKIANKAFDEGELILAGSMYKELAQYVSPKRKSIEMTTLVTYEDRLRSMSEEELDKEFKGMKLDPANLQ
jgi:hypothetical protein